MLNPELGQELSFGFVGASQSGYSAIVAVPPPTKLPAWSLPLRVFSPRIWLALLGAAVAYALAWRVVAGESLAASAAAALRAFSSCGGAPQDRVRATPQRLQLAAALLASAVVVAAAYQDLAVGRRNQSEADSVPRRRAPSQVESGFQQNDEDVLAPAHRRPLAKKGDEPRTLELQDLRPRLALLCAGLALAAAAFGAEMARSGGVPRMRRSLRTVFGRNAQLVGAERRNKFRGEPMAFPSA